MMKLAVNFSTPLIRLLNEKTIEVDLIKIPDWKGMFIEANPHGPLTIHYDLEIGLANTFNANFSRIIELKEKTFTPHINTHLVTPKSFNADNPQERKEINRLWRDEMMYMIDHVGAELVALEHYPYTFATPNIKFAADSRVFSQVIYDTNCNLLLDLAHARITANTLDIDVKDYIRSLPLDRLVEVHITGIRLHNGILTDHFQLSEEDWHIFRWAVNEIKSGSWQTPKIIAFEYGGVGSTFVWRTSYDVLRNQVPLLYEITHS